MNKIIPFSVAKSTLSLSEKIGQLFMPAAFINDTESEIVALENLIKTEHIGGICFFHSRASAATNYEGEESVVVRNEKSLATLKKLIQRYQNASKYPLLIAIDAEWGLAMRVENTPQYPYALTLGALAESDLVYQVGQQIAMDCKAAGIHWNLAPVVDINNNPNNPVIGYRAFGADKNVVTKHASAFIKGTENAGVLTSIKHFPGHGDTDTDSHLGLPVINKTKEALLANELAPFQKLIDDGVDSVMVGHLAVPSLSNGEQISSSISKAIITDLLRNEMGFNGVVISDALNMHAVSKNYKVKGELEWLAFDAGNDVLCFAENTKEGIQLIAKNANNTQIEASFKRIWELKEKAFKVTNFQEYTASELNTKLAKESITLFKALLKDIDINAINFNGIKYGNNSDVFFDEIQEKHQFKVLNVDDKITGKNLLLALNPPEIKPNNNFGFSDAEISKLNQLLENNQVIVYVFGNPYVLHCFDYNKAESIILAHQNFKEFQEVAAQHFLGEIRLKGQVSLAI